MVYIDPKQENTKSEIQHHIHLSPMDFIYFPSQTMFSHLSYNVLGHLG